VLRILVLVSMLFGGLGATSALAVPKLDPKRTAVIEGVIRGGNLDDVAVALEKWSRDGSKKPISLIINSPGGAVTTGFLFLNRMRAAKATGTPINCYVPEVAASMAFQILMHCDNRYVLDRSFLLWHRVRVMGGFTPLTAPLLKYLGLMLQKLDSVITKELVAVLGTDMTRGAIAYHFENESLHTGVDLASLAPSAITSYSSIPKLYELLENEDIPRTPRYTIFSNESGGELFAPGTYYYMSGQAARMFGVDVE
jgi:hypothetical protein